MKKILIGFVVVVVLLVTAASLWVDEIVGTAIEEAGSYAMGVETRVGFLLLRFVHGDFRMRRFRIDNPSGYGKDHFLTLSEATIGIERATLTEPVVVIPELRLEGIDVSLERDGKQTNYGAILANIQRFESANPQSTTPPPDEAGSSQRFIVNRILIRDVDAYVEWSELATDETGIQVQIPQIELKNVGAANGQGVAMSELTSIVMKAILGSIARHGGGLPDAMLSALEKDLSGVARVPGVVVSGLGGSAVQQAGERVGGEIGDAIMGVGGDASESVGDAVGRSAKRAFDDVFGAMGDAKNDPKAGTKGEE